MSDSHHDQEAPSYDDINTPVVLLVGAISAIVTLITIFLVQGLCYQWQNDYLTRRENTEPTSRTAVKKIEEQKANLFAESNTLNIDEAKSKVAALHK